MQVVHPLDVDEEAAAVLFVALDMGWGEPVLDPFVVWDDGRSVWHGNGQHVGSSHGKMVRTVNTELFPSHIDSRRRGFAINVDVEERSVEELRGIFNLDVLQDGSYKKSAIMYPGPTTGHAQYSDV